MIGARVLRDPEFSRQESGRDLGSAVGTECLAIDAVRIDQTEPVNARTEKTYNGINIVSLWVAAEVRGFTAPLWATYRHR